MIPKCRVMDRKLGIIYNDLRGSHDEQRDKCKEDGCADIGDAAGGSGGAPCRSGWSGGRLGGSCSCSFGGGTLCICVRCK